MNRGGSWNNEANNARSANRNNNNPDNRNNNIGFRPARSSARSSRSARAHEGLNRPPSGPLARANGKRPPRRVVLVG